MLNLEAEMTEFLRVPLRVLPAEPGCVIDCDTCSVRGDACADCVVSVMLGGPPESVAPEEQRALDVLAGLGLVPPLQMTPAPDAATPPDGPASGAARAPGGATGPGKAPGDPARPVQPTSDAPGDSPGVPMDGSGEPVFPGAGPLPPRPPRAAGGDGDTGGVPREG